MFVSQILTVGLLKGPYHLSLQMKKGPINWYMLNVQMQIFQAFV